MQQSILDLFKLHGQTALVVGGNRGLGLAMAKALAEAGAVPPEKQVTAEFVNGNVSITAQNLYLPCCCTPKRKRKSMLLLGLSGETNVADMLLLKPPPFACVGGCSRRAPTQICCARWRGERGQVNHADTQSSDRRAGLVCQAMSNVDRSERRIVDRV